ncbi:MAG: nucleotide sugar dehydrogenase [Actinobacteria bacterium]|nr:nucleotide sugar dehydrogenase [Actinomycetota bacterium]
MKVSVLGLGYVGAVSAACLSRDGHEVVGVDVNPVKVDQMNEGRSPVIEAGVEGLIRQGLAAGSLRATRDSSSAVLDTEISIVCVGTPSQRNGDLDLSHVENVCRQIGSVLATKEARHVVVIRSTVLPGTVEARLIPILERQSGKEVGRDFGICMHPEFLREGTAVRDYDNPAYVVIGELEAASGDRVVQLYGRVDAPIIRTSVRTAEMVKYASNAFHAVKVAFANEVGSFCKRHGIDGREVMEIVCRDRKLNISSAYLRPGFAFGGSCLPKDLRALVHRSKMTDVDCAVLMATLHSNRAHLERGLALVEDRGSR